MQVFLTRTLVTFISGVAVLYFTYWAGGALAFTLGVSPWILFVGSLAAGVLAARYVWRHTSSTHPGLSARWWSARWSPAASGFPLASSARSSSCPARTRVRCSVFSSPVRLDLSRARSAARSGGSCSGVACAARGGNRGSALQFTLPGSLFSVRVQVRFEVPGSEFRVPGSGSGFGVPASGFWVRGSGFGVVGSVFVVPSPSHQLRTPNRELRTANREL